MQEHFFFGFRENPRTADGGFGLCFSWRCRCWVMWREGIDSIPWAFPFVCREKRGKAERRALCVLLSIQLFFHSVCLGQAKGFREVLLGFAWGGFARELEFLKPASVVKPTLEVLLSVFRLCSCCCSVPTATLLSRQPKHTEKKSLILFLCLLLSKKEPNLKRMCWVSERPDERLKQFFVTYPCCASTAPCGAVQFTNLFSFFFSRTDNFLCLCLCYHYQRFNSHTQTTFMLHLLL